MRKFMAAVTVGFIALVISAVVSARSAQAETLIFGVQSASSLTACPPSGACTAPLTAPGFTATAADPSPALTTTPALPNQTPVVISQPAPGSGNTTLRIYNGQIGVTHVSPTWGAMLRFDGIDQAGSKTNVALIRAETDGSAPSITGYPILRLNAGGGRVSVDSGALSIAAGGEIDYAGKCDSTATPGAATCNETAGRAAVAAGQTSVTITNALVTATSIILVTPQTLDGTCLYPRAAVPGAGSFTFTMGPAACTAAARFSWVVHN